MSFDYVLCVDILRPCLLGNTAQSKVVYSQKSFAHS